MKQNSKESILANHTRVIDVRRGTKTNKHSTSPARFKHKPWDDSAITRGAIWYYVMARRVF